MDDVKKLLEKINDRLEKVDDRLGSIDKTLVSHDAQLAEHMRRTAIAEERLDILRNELKPVEKHVAVVGAIGKWVTGSAGIALLALLLKYALGS